MALSTTTRFVGRSVVMSPSLLIFCTTGIPAVTRRMAEIIARHSNRPVEQVMRDIDRDKFMPPEEAVEYGLIDEVVTPRNGVGG